MIKFKDGFIKIKGDILPIVTDFIGGLEIYFQDKELREFTKDVLLMEGLEGFLKPSKFWVEFAELIGKYNNEFENKKSKNENDGE